MSSFPPVADQLALLTRGVVDLHSLTDLERRLNESRESGKPLRVKAGFDPTRPDLHLGHAVLLQKMRQFQDFGHEVTFLIGGFTAMIGDPTGHNDARPRLTREEVDAAAKTYLDQAHLVLDPHATKVLNNQDWLGTMTPVEMIDLMAKHTVARMLERKDFKDRFARDQPIHQHEFFYPLAQGYDSVKMETDVELGGTDQLFNLMVGRVLMKRYGLPEQIVMTTPILEGIDAHVEDGHVVGKKMSKSADNYIGLREAPVDQYRKIMQIDDQVIWRYFALLSSKSNEEIAALHQQGDPRAAKGAFAKEIITRFHGAAAADQAEGEFMKVYFADAIPADEDIPSRPVSAQGSSVPIYVAIKLAELVSTTSEGKRLVEQGGVSYFEKLPTPNPMRRADLNTHLEVGRTYVVRVGSKNRRYASITIT